MSKTYNLSEMRKVICWVPSVAGAAAFLEAHGVTPTAVFETSKRVYRLYDEPAMQRARELRKAHDEEVAAKRAGHAQAMREKFARQRAEGAAKQRKPRAASPTVGPELALAGEALSTLMERVEALHVKLDALAAQHSSPDFDDEPKAGGSA